MSCYSRIRLHTACFIAASSFCNIRVMAFSNCRASILAIAIFSSRFGSAPTAQLLHFHSIPSNLSVIKFLLGAGETLGTDNVVHCVCSLKM